MKSGIQDDEITVIPRRQAKVKKPKPAKKLFPQQSCNHDACKSFEESFNTCNITFDAWKTQNMAMSKNKQDDSKRGCFDSKEINL